jgi:hypothetical protein
MFLRRGGTSIFTSRRSKRRSSSARTTGAIREVVARERLDEYVGTVARNYSVTLYYDRLKQLMIMPFNMVVKPFIGFGGTMPASPGLTPLYRWVGQAEGINQVFP